MQKAAQSNFIAAIHQPNRNVATYIKVTVPRIIHTNPIKEHTGILDCQHLIKLYDRPSFDIYVYRSKGLRTGRGKEEEKRDAPFVDNLQISPFQEAAHFRFSG